MTYYLFGSYEEYYDTFPESSINNNGARTNVVGCSFKGDLTLFKNSNFQISGGRARFGLNDRYTRLRTLENVKNSLDEYEDYRNKVSSLKIEINSLTSPCGDFVVVFYDNEDYQGRGASIIYVLRNVGEKINESDLSHIPRIGAWGSIIGTWDNRIDSFYFGGGCEGVLPSPYCN